MKGKKGMSVPQFVETYRINLHPVTFLKSYLKPHLNELESLGIVEVDRKVKVVLCYILDPEGLFRFYEEKGIVFPIKKGAVNEPAYELALA